MAIMVFCTEAVAQANGSGIITLSFQTGTNPGWPRLTYRPSRATPRLPLAVTQQRRGGQINANFLLFAILSS
jgi:multidrug efflux pump